MTLTSPFARIARIALLETGLDASVAKVELTRERLYSAESDVLSVRVPAWDWRSSRPRLAAWFDAVSARPSFRATMPPG
jgi:glutathione S-transferase